MKIRTKLSLTLFALTCALISIFSLVIFHQVRERALTEVQKSLVNDLEHEWNHYAAGTEKQEELLAHHKGIYHRIYQEDKLVADGFPKEMDEEVSVGVHDNYVIVQTEKQSNGINYRIMGAADLRSFRSYLRLLGGLFIVGCLLVAGFMGPASWWIAGISLAPFRKLAAQTAKLDARALSYRFPKSHSDDEFGRLVDVFNLLLSRLDKSFGELNLFAAKASHELKTPLAAIIAQTEKLLRRKVSNEEQIETLQKVLIQAVRLSRVTEQLLVLADVDSKRGQPRTMCTDIAKVLREIAEIYSQKAVTLNKHIEFDLRSNLQIVTDIDLLTTSVGTLMENALKFGRRNVAVKCRKDGANLLVTVEDDGPGIRAEDRQRVLAPFEKVASLWDGSANRGSGLGLAIAKTAVDSLEGRLYFEESNWGGLKAVISLPASTETLTKNREV